MNRADHCARLIDFYCVHRALNLYPLEKLLALMLLQLKDKEFQTIGALALKAFREDTSLTHGGRNESRSDERNDQLDS